MKNKRFGFTLIELLFVIIIFGIIGSMTLEIVRQYYDGIYRTIEYEKRASQANLLLEQLSKYFENAISASIVNLDEDAIGAGDCKIPDIADVAHDYTVAFIAVDNDSLRGGWDGTRFIPGWNEDVNISGTNTITQTGADYTKASAITAALNGSGDLTASAIYNNSKTASNAGGCFDYRLDVTTTAINDTKFLEIDNPITASTLTLFRSLDNDNEKRAYLLRTAYAFRVHDDVNGSFHMYSNFRPWAGTRYNTTAGKLLATNVAHFYADYNASDFNSNPDITGRGLVWRLKVCMRGLDDNLSNSEADANNICRERRVRVRY